MEPDAHIQKGNPSGNVHNARYIARTHAVHRESCLIAHITALCERSTTVPYLDDGAPHTAGSCSRALTGCEKRTRSEEPEIRGATKNPGLPDQIRYCGHGERT